MPPVLSKPSSTPRSASSSKSARSNLVSPAVRAEQRIMKKQQKSAANLTTVDHTGGIPIMSTFPYPVDDDGQPITPDQILSHLRNHVAPLPLCMCNALARFISPIRTGEHVGKNAFACGLGYECSFWFCVEDVLFSGKAELRYETYSRKGHTKLPPDIYITPCDLASRVVTPSNSQGSATSRSTASSSDFSWSPVRRLLEMRAPSSSPAKDEQCLTAVIDLFAEPSGSSGNLFPGLGNFVPIPIGRPGPLPFVKQESVSPDSSVSSAGIGPIYGAKYYQENPDSPPLPIFDTKGIPLPRFPLSGDHKLELWSPPPVSALLKPVASSKAPLSAAKLLSPTGHSVDHFWSMFEFYAGLQKS
ncbi:hypothetical protein DFH07DRAFT_1037353 [Mycena maculata]|uniref:Uncharacterized protein n=1 Tax=Mycena maculata TaxID=230809 RepID=A0AAD7IP33_9AGAR|nr:hypothetical protein DFH07DRAFT_1037353 [Mycena maculata]